MKRCSEPARVVPAVTLQLSMWEALKLRIAGQRSIEALLNQVVDAQLDAQIQKLVLADDDVVLVRCEENLSMAAAEAIRGRFEESAIRLNCPSLGRVVVVSGGLDISVLGTRTAN